MNVEHNITFFSSPIGLWVIEDDGKAIYHVYLKDDKEPLKEHPSPLGKRAASMMKEYFEGERTSFEGIPLKIIATPFRKRVYEGLHDIPYGETWSYKQLADYVGCPKAVRAVGQAMKANPIPIFYPCHRVIAADGSIGGFSIGIKRKEFLLELEKSAKRE